MSIKNTTYERQNELELEQRIIFFLRNYIFQDTQLASELAKQFNITEYKALEEIQKLRTKYPSIKKSRKISNIDFSDGDL